MTAVLGFQCYVLAALLFIKPAEKHIHPVVVRFVWMWLW